MLANSLMSLVDWLLKCIQCGQVPKDGTKNELDDRIASTAIKVLIFLLSTEFIYSLLFLAKHDNPGKFNFKNLVFIHEIKSFCLLI